MYTSLLDTPFYFQSRFQTAGIVLAIFTARWPWRQ